MNDSFSNNSVDLLSIANEAMSNNEAASSVFLAAVWALTALIAV